VPINFFTGDSPLKVTRCWVVSVAETRQTWAVPSSVESNARKEGIKIFDLRDYAAQQSSRNQYWIESLCFLYL
jgi:hypothetical protein